MSSEHPLGIVGSKARLEMVRSRLLRSTMRWTFGVYVLAVLAASYYAWTVGDLYLLPIYVFFSALLALLAYWPRIAAQWQGVGLLGMMYAAVLLNLATEGRGAMGRIFVLMMSYTAVLFFGVRAGLVALAGGIGTWFLFAWLYTEGYMVGVPDVDSTIFAGWLSNSFFLLFIGLYVVLSLYYLLSNLLQTLHESNVLARELHATQATLEAKVAERTRTAELARREAEQTRINLEKQMWFTVGQAQLGEVMRGEQEIDELGHHIVTHLCRYLDLPVGALYLLDNHQMALTLHGRFAYKVNSAEEMHRFRLGEGLVGQVAEGRESLLVTNAPASLLGIESSLGTAVAAHLLLQPIWYEHILLGVLVLGHWQPFTDQQTEFITAVTDSMAVALHTARTRDYINLLLEQVG